MVIGIDGSRAFTKGRTGTENYSYQILKSLAKIDSKNTYKIFLRPNYSSNEVRSNENNTWPKNFQFIEIKWPRLWTQGGLSLKTFSEKIDVLFVPAHTIPLFYKKGLKTVITVHDLGSEFLPKTHQLKQRLYLGLMQKLQLKMATKLIAVSKATKEDLVKKLNIPAKKIEVVYEGYSQDKFKVQMPNVKNDVEVNSLRHYNLVRNNYYLFVGTVQPRKNLVRLITAFFNVILKEAKRNEGSVYPDKYLNTKLIDSSAALQNDKTELVIVGKRGWMADEIYELPKKLGIEKQVKFLDYVPDEDLPVLYSGAKALLFPSLFEGFGLPILEAQACGCPVLTSNVSSMAEVAGYVRVNQTVAGKGAVLVDPYSIEDISEGIKRLEARGEREKLIKLGLENAKRFSWDKAAMETLKILEQVASSK